MTNSQGINNPKNEDPLFLSDVLLEEYKILHPENETLEQEWKSLSENKRLEKIFDAVHTLEEKRSALCLSGGGVRSATFCLGVLQGLARKNLLDKFHYLSTVSGGGYIGGWLTAWITRNKSEDVFKILKDNEGNNRANKIIEPEPKEITHLRSYSNLLTPKIGILSVDTWTLIAIYVRNLFLNWLVLIPFILALLLIPRMYSSLMNRKFGGWVPEEAWSISFMILGFILGAFALAYVSSHRPSLRKDGGETKKEDEKEDSNETRNFGWFFMLPLLAAVFFLTVGRAWFVHDPCKSSATNLDLTNFINCPYWAWLRFALGGALLMFLAWFFTFFSVKFFFRRTPAVYKTFLENKPKRIIELFVVLITGFLGGVCLWLLSLPEEFSKFLTRCGSPDKPEFITSCAGLDGAEKLIKVFESINNSQLSVWLDGPKLMLVFLFMGILSNGIGSRGVNDDDREWWARSAAYVFLVIVIWTVVNALVIWVPNNLYIFGGYITRIPLVLIGSVTGFVTILFALSSKTPANDRQAEKAGRLTTVLDYGAKLAAPIFTGFLVVFLSFFTDFLIVMVKNIFRIIRPVDNWNLPFKNWIEFQSHILDYNYDALIQRIHTDTPFLLLFCIFLVLLSISGVMAFFININHFSLHSLYRNRLIRTYLGASNPERKLSTFTNFDQNDDLRMSDLEFKSEPKKGIKLFHIVNMTWNLVNGKKLEWQNRKATTFTVSKLHCGNYQSGYRRSEEYGGESSKSFWRSLKTEFEEILPSLFSSNNSKAESPNNNSKAISLGTALTISGAAASPNMGYYSSTFVTFLMTLFNARLGWWLGNPRKETYKRSGPGLALRPLINEAFGKTEEDKGYIYLSDGGHFENLGLYEMVLRRCHYIFVVDASRDPDRKFENLGNAIRRIRVDLGIDIEMENYPRKQDDPSPYCAIGTIYYSKIDGEKDGNDGILIYIKPSLIGDEPTDIFNYAQDNIKFPHEPTSDMWFSEQQFESYRALGSYAIDQIFKRPLEEGEDLSNLEKIVRDYMDKSKYIPLS